MGKEPEKGESSCPARWMAEQELSGKKLLGGRTAKSVSRIHLVGSYMSA